ncbi:CHAP domain-containing protein [Erysipelothrix sp. HDW6C]|uniref:CHAP domain-containing protein n=1 Tax=Erysipelothrix sp. HDW6C TaxID=2714930 RepID=UPI001407BA53|nr:CHAP domain-containing protein [Erysipelothrix sp. HDW6C]QIK70831.1 CHAP domain-containing protein [Erysipelothrix sp. HDW6C]
MGTFKIRKNGADLQSLPFYNTYGGGSFNALQDEYAPKSCGGTMSAMTNKNAAGNCTWYGVGRQQEATGYRVPLERRRGNAKDWSVDTNTPTVGALVVFVDAGYGHVAFVEKIENGEVYVSESAYSERGNDFLFKYGRTVSEICRVWDMTVKGYMLPDGEFTSYDDVQGELKAENGIVTATDKNGSNIRKGPSLSAERVDGLPYNEELPYTHYVINEGIVWVKTSKGYIARREADNSKEYSAARFVGEPAKPTPPKTNVGRYANLSGQTWLFKVSRTDETYPGGYNQLTDLANRSAKILEEDNGRVKISVPSFDPNIVWVANSQISVTDAPKYEIK